MRQTVTQASEQSGVFPSLCRGKMLLRLLVLTQAVAILLAFAPGISGDPWLRLGVISLCSHWITLLSLGFLCPLLRRLSVNQLHTSLLLIATVLLLGTCLVTVAIWFGLPELLVNYRSFAAFLASNLVLASVVGLLIGQLVLMHAERARLIAAQGAAEFSAFQARIQPHFLFNSLNAMAELVHQDPKAAEQALLDLADLFRAAMHAGDLLELTQELELVRKYLAIEQWRLGAKLQVEWLLPSGIPSVKLPALTLQPLVENAVRYGVEPSTQPVVITLQVIVGSQQVSVLITNPLPDTVVSGREQNGVALHNIQARLELLYGSQQQLFCRQLAGEYRVKLVLPLTDKVSLT